MSIICVLKAYYKLILMKKYMSNQLILLYVLIEFTVRGFVGFYWKYSGNWIDFKGNDLFWIQIHIHCGVIRRV